MRKFLKTFSATIVGVSLLSLPLAAQAQELTLRLEPGVAIPVTDPQAQRFHVGGALSVKPEIGIGSYFSAGPSLSVLALPSAISGIDAGTAFGVGGFARVKRPHDAKNADTGLSAVSPWVDADLQYVRTDPLDRLGWSVAAGASVPTSDSRNLWVGPFVRYQSVFQEDKPGYNSNSAKIVIVGLSFEFGAGATKKAIKEPTVPPCPPAQEPTPVPTPEPTQPVPTPVVYQDVDVELHQTVQFAWDSPVLDTIAKTQLAEVIKQINAGKNLKSISVEGHASSEGQVKHNDILSQKRAESVVDFLVANGVPKEKLSATGFGSKVPVATNKTEAGRVLNRRDEFVVKFVVVKESK